MSINESVPEHLALERLHGFMSALAAERIAPGPEKGSDFLRAVALSRLRSIRDLYWRARVTLVRDVEEVERFDRLFAVWFGETVERTVPPVDRWPRKQEAVAGGGAARGAEERIGRRGSGREASRETLLTRPSFAATTAEQTRQLADLKRTLCTVMPTTRGRRQAPSKRVSALDVRRVTRQAARSAGEVRRLYWRDRPERPRRVLLLVDVSGSLRENSGEYLRFAHSLVRALPRSEVFTFGTQLSRVTRVLRRRDTDDALAALAEVVLDVNGGTRIGSSLREFLDDDRSAAMARDALVVIISDGLERGDPRAMIEAVERVSRLAYRLVWWSPLACDARYRPVTRGMAGISDLLDDLAGVRDLASAREAVERLPLLERRPRGSAVKDLAVGMGERGG